MSGPEKVNPWLIAVVVATLVPGWVPAALWSAQSAPESGFGETADQVIGPVRGGVRLTPQEPDPNAVHGVGPAIIAYFLKAFEDAANLIGVPRRLGRESVLQTIIATSEMILRSDRHVSELIDSVASPGGVTTRVLQVLQQGRFSAVLTDAVEAAYRRTLELGVNFEEQLRLPEPQPTDAEGVK